MSADEIRKSFLSFFKGKGHAIVPSSSLLPDDPSVLLTTAGMQQFKKYFTGALDAEKDFGAQNIASVQKCFRTSDIDEVGDESHLTFFEMLGNFSFGGYWKKEAIEYAHEFITKVMKLEIDYVTVFDPEKISAGDWRKGVLFDKKSYDIWKKIAPDVEIRREGADNFWGPTGSEGPCGPTTEIYVNGVEIWNIVFNQFYKKPNSSLEPLPIQGVDTGMGLERLAMAVQKTSTIFETDLFLLLFALLPKEIDERKKRIFADHARGIAFLIADGIRPSNKEAGYVLRRLIRRLIAYDPHPISALLSEVTEKYDGVYPALDSKIILDIFQEEEKRFAKTLQTGLKELERLSEIDAIAAFKLYESFGLPFETIKEMGGAKAKKLKRDDFDKEFAKHQEISRAGAEKKFGGHGIYLKTGEVTVKDPSELAKVTRLHTATHLMHAALRQILGPEVRQNGSDITVERTRFDFNFPRKVTKEELGKVESLVNEVIQKDLPVGFMELSKTEAEKTGALYFFKEKYPERVKVYYIGKSLDDAFSKEFCGGPHVTHTGEVGKFTILKEEAVGAGMRRTRAIIEP